MKIIFKFPKSKLPLVTLCCVISFLWASLSSFSQNIPDANFANAIRSACPTCIDVSNNLLPPATSLTNLDVSNKNIADLTGIGGFTSLLYLYCNNNKLTILPALPVNLSWLFCEINQLTSLPNLPNNLTLLFCQGNQLTSLPDLPITLNKLICDGNKLITLPPIPNSLTHLYCGHNKLTSLPDISNLYWLDCSHNQLTTLPTLSNHLFLLGCSYNNLKTLPILPNSIRELYCNNNQIINLPTLPIGGLFFNFTNNPLTCLPTLPNNLLNLYIDSDKITCLPNSVPDLKVYDNNSMLIPTPPLCPTTLTHTPSTLPTGTYVATQVINSKATLSVGITNYHASQAITLNPGFQTAAGRTFSAEIRGCK